MSLTQRSATTTNPGAVIENEMGASIDSAAPVIARLATRSEEPLGAPKLLVVLAHPDDEVLALGGRLERMCRSRLLTATDGAPEDGEDARAHGFAALETYIEARREELQAALRLAGLPERCSEPLRVEVGGSSRVLADQTAAFHLAALTLAVLDEIRSFRPEAVLTHPYEGGHPDHDSCAFAVHAAMRLLEAGQRVPVVEAPFYHAGPSGFETGSFLPRSGESGGNATVFELSEEEQVRKRERLDCFVSQQQTLAQFGTERESFRVAPVYDFTRPPHGGRLLYEGFPWGMTGERLCDLAAHAFEELGLAVARREAC